MNAMLVGGREGLKPKPYRRVLHSLPLLPPPLPCSPSSRQHAASSARQCSVCSS